MATRGTEERIGEAWRLHRKGDNRGAIQMFNEILSKTPNNVDAHYGIGLAQRAEGDNAGAEKSFTRALELAQAALDAVKVTSVVDGHGGGNDLDTYEDDRFMMLSRMLQQRISELKSNN